MATCDEQGYVQVEDNSVGKTPWQRRRVWVVCCSVLGATIIGVLWSQSLIGTQVQISGQPQSGVDNLISLPSNPIMQGSVGQSMPLSVVPGLSAGAQYGQPLPQYAPQAANFPFAGQPSFEQTSNPFAPAQGQALRTLVVPNAGAGWGRAATDEELAVELPKLYVYDHCPFCVRARMIFGLKGINYDLRFLQNDDVRTPTKLIGKKVLPILEDAGITTGTKAMGESLDIVAYVESKSGTTLLKPKSDRADLKAWDKKLKDVRSKLTRPRTGQSPMPEFGTKKAAETWIQNHPIKPVGSMTYQEAMAKTPEFLGIANEALRELDPLIHSPESISPGGVSYDDIVYFPPLRSLTLIKGIVFPPRVEAYVNKMAEIADVPLLWQMAI